MIDVRIADEGGSVSLSATDRGIGFGGAKQLFRRYARALGAVEEGIPGIGLGLYLVRGIVEAHGGTIQAESPGRGQGATFRVVIPRAVPAEIARQATPGTPTQDRASTASGLTPPGYPRRSGGYT